MLTAKLIDDVELGCKRSLPTIIKNMSSTFYFTYVQRLQRKESVRSWTSDCSFRTSASNGADGDGISEDWSLLYGGGPVFITIVVAEGWRIVRLQNSIICHGTYEDSSRMSFTIRFIARCFLNINSPLVVGSDLPICFMSQPIIQRLLCISTAFRPLSIWRPTHLTAIPKW